MPDNACGNALEQFVTAACHNLREALRPIAVQAEISGDACLEEQARVMEAILKGISDYAVASGTVLEPVPVSVESALNQALLYLDREIVARGAAIELGPLPEVMADPVQLDKIFRLLLDNALKYCGNPGPRIRVSSQQDGAVWRISVSDNGPGIEKAYQERVFVPFKRLHGRDNPGNGLGLAICRQLVARLDGRIWIESPAHFGSGSGTTVCFTLPTCQ